MANNATGGILAGYNAARIEAEVKKNKARDVQRASGHVEDMCDEMFGEDSGKLPWPKPPDAGGRTKSKGARKR